MTAKIEKLDDGTERATRTFGLGGGTVQAERGPGGEWHPTLGDKIEAAKLAEEMTKLTANGRGYSAE